MINDELQKAVVYVFEIMFKIRVAKNLDSWKNLKFDSLKKRGKTYNFKLLLPVK